MSMFKLDLGVEFKDGSKCIINDVLSNFTVCGSGLGLIKIVKLKSSFLIGIELNVDKPLSGHPFYIKINGLNKASSILGLTLLNLSRHFIMKAFRYYNYIVQGKEPRSEPPEDKPQYPPKIDRDSRINSDFIDCWAYPYWVNDYSELYPYTVMVLGNSNNNEYITIFTFSNPPLTTWIEGGPVIRAYINESIVRIPMTYIASISFSKDPYDAIKSAVIAASRVSAFKPRWLKKRPVFMDGLGWCSWNALLSDDLNHDNVVNIIKGLRDRGIPISWVLIDDGWQWLENGLLKSTKPDKLKFPKGFKALIDELKSLGIRDVGLWFTINMYWNGVSKELLEELNAPGLKTESGYIPEPNLEGAFRLYDTWLKLINDEGFSFVKVDNQCSIHRLYRGFVNNAYAAKSIELALQLAAEVNGMDVLNCMSMLPDNYSNYVLSNALRVSIDYIPMWQTDAKLHTLWSAYNSLLYSIFGYPDYDMWMSYDPAAKLIAISRVFSGGPIYITDREPAKSNVGLIKMITLSNGEVIKVDEPSVPTKDVLFRNPYDEPILLKLASTVNGYPTVAFMNINRDDVEILEEFSVRNMPMNLKYDNYVYYKVFTEEWGLMNSGDYIKVKLGRLDAEVIILAPIIANKAIIGIKGKVLPPYPINVNIVNEEFLVRARDTGKLLIYKDGNLEELNVEEGLLIKV